MSEHGSRSTYAIPMAGRRFGMLLVTTESRAGKCGKIWRCICDCGNEKWVEGRVLRRPWSSESTIVKSCGCRLTERQRQMMSRNGRPRLKFPPGVAASHRVFGSYVYKTKKVGLTWALDFDMFMKITQSDCAYCGAAPAQVHLPNNGSNGPFTYNGIDRTDNERGYEDGNVVPCCGYCNRMKSNKTVHRFLDHVNRIARHQRSKAT